jgi:hypothetical protein
MKFCCQELSGALTSVTPPESNMKPNKSPKKLTDFKTPEELVSIVKSDRLRLMLYTVASGQRFPGDPRPQWAIQAAIEFSKSWQDFPKTRLGQSEAYQLGFSLALMRSLPRPKGMELEPELCSLVSLEEIAPQIHAEAASAPMAEASDFYAGLSDGLKQTSISPTSRCVTFLMLALLWPELSQFKNVTDLHCWFEQNFGENRTGSRDRTAKICWEIGLRFPDRGGRPSRKPRKDPGS